MGANLAMLKVGWVGARIALILVHFFTFISSSLESVICSYRCRAELTDL